MKEFWKTTIILSIVGLVIGLLVGVLFLIPLPPADAAETQDEYNVLLHMILSGIYGMVCMGTSSVYSIEEWSVTRATVTHLLVVSCGFCVIGSILGWITPGELMFWVVILAMIVAYWIIWLVMYMRYKKKVKKMNDDLKKWKSERHES